MKLDKIVERTILLFLKSGFSRTNTDEISEHAGVSKRTLYKYFETKDKLINAVIEKFQSKLSLEFEIIINNKSLNPLEKLKTITSFFAERSSLVSKELYNDIEIYRPDLYEIIKENRKNSIQSLISVISEGQKLNLIRKDIDPQFAIDVILSAAEEILKPSNLASKEYSGKSAHAMLFQIFIEGIQQV